jgi:hypothetical protein
MNSNNLQASNTKAVAYAMGIDHTMVKAKVTWYYLFSFSYKTTIGMKMLLDLMTLVLKPCTYPSYPYA